MLTSSAPKSLKHKKRQRPDPTLSALLAVWVLLTNAAPAASSGNDWWKLPTPTPDVPVDRAAWAPKDLRANVIGTPDLARPFLVTYLPRNIDAISAFVKKHHLYFEDVEPAGSKERLAILGGSPHIRSIAKDSELFLTLTLQPDFTPGIFYVWPKDGAADRVYERLKPLGIQCDPWKPVNSSLAPFTPIQCVVPEAQERFWFTLIKRDPETDQITRSPNPLLEGSLNVTPDEGQNDVLFSLMRQNGLFIDPDGGYLRVREGDEMRIVRLLRDHGIKADIAGVLGGSDVLVTQLSGDLKKLEFNAPGAGSTALQNAISQVLEDQFGKEAIIRRGPSVLQVKATYFKSKILPLGPEAWEKADILVMGDIQGSQCELLVQVEASGTKKGTPSATPIDAVFKPNPDSEPAEREFAEKLASTIQEHFLKQPSSH